MAQEEQVLVIPRKELEKVGIFHGLMMDADKYLKSIFTPGVPRFMPRSLAEKDPSFKQIIPYVLMACDGRYLSYVRGKRAGETRLVGNRSIGIGGHINPTDDMALFGDFYETYLNAVKREVEEEVTVGTTFTNQIVALLNDDSNEVGSVHLGVVHLWTLDAPEVARREQMITQMAFMSLPELRAAQNTLETWSALCLGYLNTLAASK